MDPLGYDAGDVNLYRYVGNAPTTFLDPSGLDRIERVKSGDMTLIWYIPERWFGRGDGPGQYVGRLVEINGLEYVERSIDGQRLLVPLHRVEETAGFWADSVKDWRQWFRENNVLDQGGIVANATPDEGPDFYLFGQPSYWPWSERASWDIWDNMKHKAKMVPVAVAGTVGGAVTGSAVGSVCPGVGTGVGAGWGGVGGLIAAAFAKDAGEAAVGGMVSSAFGIGGVGAAGSRLASRVGLSCRRVRAGVASNTGGWAAHLTGTDLQIIQEAARCTTRNAGFINHLINHLKAIAEATEARILGGKVHL